MKALWILLPLLAGCQLISAGYNVGSKVGAVVLDERDLKDDWNDSAINVAIRSNLTTSKPAYLIDLEITVFEGEVMLNGALPSIEDIENVVEITWAAGGVTKVYNHIRVEAPGSVVDASNDAMIASSIRTELMFTQKISSVNYKITVDNGTLYMMGIAKNQDEFDAVMNVIYNTKGVERVVSHIRKSYESNQP